MADQPVWRQVAQALCDHGAIRCFGLVGGANFKVTHALTELGIPFVSARHEGGAVTMADASARLTGALTIVSVTAGPGLTNAITGIGEAAKSDTPLVILAGDVPVGDRTSSFSIRQEDLVRSVGASWIQIDEPSSSYRSVREAAAHALRERQVVVISLPTDVQEQMSEAGPWSPLDSLTPPQPDDTAIDAVVDMIRTARRPLILAGHGADVADAESLLDRLAGAVDGLLATSLQAHGMFADHPWNLGIAGGYASPAASDLIRQSDLVIVFGASLNMWTTKNGRLIRNDTRIVQVESRAGRFGRFSEVALRIHGDAAQTARRILEALAASGSSPIGRWRTPEVAAVIHDKSHRHLIYGDRSDGRYIDPRTFTKAVDAILPADRIVVLDGGHFTGWPIHHLSVPNAGSFCIPIAFQSIGLGLAAAVGASVSFPQRLVVLAAGDGGFLMSLAELETAVRLDCRMCILIYNDAAYSAEVHHFKHGYALDIVRFPETDFARAARGLGADGATIRKPEDLAALKAWVERGAPGVFVVDARVDPDIAADWFMQVIGKGNL
ncbi:thiamine pyrophosphate-binding protein [Methylobacterium nonmethylotrophicum]|nr:thiamine pyrophosphate-binding protein [Methylobacterium nonmethylotrophicum]